MSWINRMAGLFRPERLDRELDEELRFHLESRERKYLSEGMTPAEAKREARRALGGRDRAMEECRDADSVPWIESAWRDLLYAVRTLRASPLFTLTAVISLALGIGANTAIFSLIDTLLLRELPVPEPHRLFTLSKGLKSTNNISYGLFRQLEAERQTLSGIVTFHGAPRSNITIGSQSEVTDALMVSQHYFPTLGVKPSIGRGFEPADGNVTVISYRYWKRRFGGDASVLGQPLLINGAPFTVIGVTPPEFFGPIVGTWIDVTIPAFPNGSRPKSEDETVGWVMGRLADGATEQQAATTMTARAKAWMESRASRRRPVIELEPAGTGMSFLREQFSKPLRILMGMVAMVLLIACANMAGVLATRASARQREFAIRLSIGASRARLIRQLLTESTLLSLLGGAVGLLFARWSSEAVAKFVSTVKDPVGLDLSVNMHVFGFALLIATATGFVFGLAPALQGTRLDLTAALKQNASSSGGAGSKLRRVLVTSQVALAVLLVAGATSFSRSLRNLKNLDTGFHRDSVLTMSLEPAGIGYEGQQIARLYDQTIERVEAVPGVRSATFIRNNVLMGAGSYTSIIVPGRTPQPIDEMEFAPGMKMAVATRTFAVGPRFLETMGMTLLEGRDIRRTDRRGTQLVAIVNETFARHFFPGQSVVGRRFGFHPEHPDEAEIVGVFRDVKHAKLLEPATRTIYVAAMQDPGSGRNTSLNVRTAIDPARAAPAVRAAIAEVSRDLPVFNVTTLDRLFDDAVVTERTLALLSGFFGLLALLLASIGLYGLLAYSVERRRSEIGLRMALGARPGDVLAMVLRETAIWVAAGVLLGLPATLFAGQWIATYLYGLKPADPATLAITVAVLAAVAALSAWIPAHRAARTDPMIALRNE